VKIVVKNTLINYEQFGEGPEQLLILHGWGRSLAEWRETAQFCAQKYTVTIVDFPGFGSSDEPDYAWDTYDYAECVHDFLMKMGLRNVTIMGHSFGGRIATILAAEHAELVAKIVLVDAGGIEIKSMRIRLLRFVYTVCIKPFRKLLGKKFRNRFGSADYRVLSGVMRGVFKKVVNQDLRHLFGEIKQPTVVLWGSNDQVLPVSYTKVYKKEIPQSVVRIVWGADHSPYMSGKKDFFAIVTEVLL
jgi:pimeloyl-ACP methyl ester carboxylesterase